jgi:hypothetical protein
MADGTIYIDTAIDENSIKREILETEKAMKKSEERLDKLIEKQIRYIETGGNKKSKTFQGMEYDIAQEHDIYKGYQTKLADLQGAFNQSTQGKIERLKNAFKKLEIPMRNVAKQASGVGKSMKGSQRSMMKMLGTSLLIGTTFRLLMGIMNGLKQGMNNLAQYSGDANKDLSALKSSLTQLKNSFATAFAPILTVATPILTGFINIISAVVSKIGMLVAALTGKSTFTKAIAVQEDYAASLSDTAKATKKVTDYSTSLDEIDKASSSSGSSGGVAVSEMFSEEEIPSVFQNIATNMREQFSPIIELFREFGVRTKESTSTWFANLDWGPLNTSIDNLMNSLSPLTGTMLNGLGWVYENVLLPLATWTIQEAAPAGIDLLASAFDVLNEILIAISPLLTWLWDNFLQPIAEWTGGVIVDTINWLADALERVSDWISENQGLVEAFAIIVGSFAAAWFLVNTAVTLWNAIGVIATDVTTGFGVAVNFLTSPITLVALAIGALIAIIVLLVKNWDKVKEVASNVWKGIKSTWSKVSDWFSKNVLEPLVSGFKKRVNSVIGFLNKMIQGIVSGVNAAIKMVNKLSFDVPDWVPGIGGKTFGFNLKTVTAPQIPYLATGAVIPPNAPFMAVLGDQRHGTNLEAPEDLLRKIVREETAGQRGGGGVHKFIAQINRRTLFEEVVEEAKAYQRATGFNPFELA